MGPQSFQGPSGGALGAAGRRSWSYDASMQATPVTERDLPLPVRNEIRVPRDDLDEGAISPAEHDRLADELLEALGVPVPSADD